MIAIPKYREIPNFILGQNVKVTLKSERRRAKNRDVEGRVIYISNRIVTIEKINGKESICLVDFKTGNAWT